MCPLLQFHVSRFSETRGKARPDAPRMAVTLYRGDGEGVPSRGIEIRAVQGMVEVRFLPAPKGRRHEGTPLCEGAGKVSPARYFPLAEPR